MQRCASVAVGAIPIFQFTHPVRGAAPRRLRRRKGSRHFNSRTPCGVQPSQNVRIDPLFGFQFTHPVRGAAAPRSCANGGTKISIHAPRAGCSEHILRCGITRYDFNSRTPCGVQRPNSSEYVRANQFQFTHPVRGAASGRVRNLPAGAISIHAPRAGCSVCHRPGSAELSDFNSRTPCGVQLHTVGLTVSFLKFQFTHPVRGAADGVDVVFCGVYISIHAPRAGCSSAPQSTIYQSSAFQFTHPVRGAAGVQHRRKQQFRISIHAPRAGCSNRTGMDRGTRYEFQFTHPVRGAAFSNVSPKNPIRISIHAPRAGCSNAPLLLTYSGGNFNSRTPCGVQQPRPTASIRSTLFQFTHPVRGAARNVDAYYAKHKISIHAPRAGCSHRKAEIGCQNPISIHAPRAGCSCSDDRFRLKGCDFNSRTPCGVQLVSVRLRHELVGFQFTHPVRGAALALHLAFPDDFISIHAPRAGCSMPVKPHKCRRRRISIHAPRAGCSFRLELVFSAEIISIHAPRAGCSEQQTGGNAGRD